MLIGKPVHAGSVDMIGRRYDQNSKGKYLRTGIPGKLKHGHGYNTLRGLQLFSILKVKVIGKTEWKSR